VTKANRSGDAVIREHLGQEIEEEERSPEADGPPDRGKLDPVL